MTPVRPCCERAAADAQTSVQGHLGYRGFEDGNVKRVPRPDLARVQRLPAGVPPRTRALHLTSQDLR